MILKTGNFIMSENNFDPSQSAHSVDRCAAHVVFAEAIPDRLFSTVRASFADKAKAAGFTAAPMMAFRVDASSGAVQQVQEEGAAPSAFTSPDQAIQIAVTPNAVTWSNSKYVRWQPFIGDIMRVAGAGLEQYLQVVTPKIIRLEYVDSFFWAGSWEDFDAKKLLNMQSGLLAPRPIDAEREWHVHTGWFSKIDKMRRLTAANVDVREGIPPGGTINKPGIVISTLMQDELNVQGYGTTSNADIGLKLVYERLDSLHSELKKLITSIVVEPMAKRIGLLGD